MRTHVRLRAVGILLVATAPAFGAACASGGARVARFDAFAEAGTQFADAVPAVLDASFEGAVATSSLALEQARPGLLLLPDSVRETVMLEQLQQNDADLVTRLETLRDVKRHARLLREYFVALQALAQTGAESSGLTDVTGGFVEALATVAPSIGEATIGGQPVSELLPPVVDFAVTSFQSQVLEDELRRNAGAIERELALQVAFLTAVAETMASDYELVFAADDLDRIRTPYVRAGSLPRSWSDRRLGSFRRQSALSSVDAASRAAERLRTAFIQLVENRIDQATIAALFIDIHGMLTFVEVATGDDS
ncbi:MAG: hypothetical protein ACC682_11655 [Gemmatimonadota bacterium]